MDHFSSQFRNKMAIATPNNNGGYDYDLVSEPPDSLICKICHFPSRDPFLSVCCGHVFCKSCLNNVKKAAAITNACPVCRNEEFVTFPNKQAEREIKSLHIYCTNKEKGCKWQCELNDINDHLGNSDGCQFEEVKCSNECGKMIQRQYLTNHVETECPCRKVNCQYCHDTGEHQFIEGQHKEECPKLPLPCPNKCEVGSVPREDMEVHRKECPLEMIQCEYYSVGCEVRMARNDKQKHDDEQMKEHLILTKLKLDNTQHELTDTKVQFDVALKQITNLTVLMNAQLNPRNTHANIRSVYLDSMITISKFGDQVCPVIIMMPEYNDKKKHEIRWYSDPFYTHNKGYKLCLRVYAGGYRGGKGTHLSVFLCLMKGPHDNELTWPLRGEFEIELSNQISDSEHCSCILLYNDDTGDDVACRVVEDDKGLGWGAPQFISNENLYKTTPSSQYLKDDCIFFQISKLYKA